jgi:hypothetical protein
MPAIQLDLYLSELHPMQWLAVELARVVNHRINNKRPMIVDGVCALDVVDQIDRKADFLVFVRGGDEKSSSPRKYWPTDRGDGRINWHSSRLKDTPNSPAAGKRDTRRQSPLRKQ